MPTSSECFIFASYLSNMRVPSAFRDGIVDSPFGKDRAKGAADISVMARPGCDGCAKLCGHSPSSGHWHGFFFRVACKGRRYNDPCGAMTPVLAQLEIAEQAGVERSGLSGQEFRQANLSPLSSLTLAAPTSKTEPSCSGLPRQLAHGDH